MSKHKALDMFGRSGNPTLSDATFTDFENDLILKKEGEIIHFESQERHRLVGLDKIGVVAEIWIHTDLNNLSGENDIVRISDDYRRS